MSIINVFELEISHMTFYICDIGQTARFYSTCSTGTHVTQKYCSSSRHWITNRKEVMCKAQSGRWVRLDWGKRPSGNSTVHESCRRKCKQVGKKHEEASIGFLEDAVYDKLPSPANLQNWVNKESDSCPPCTGRGSLDHRWNKEESHTRYHRGCRESL